jgi:hypothetical protein
VAGYLSITLHARAMICLTCGSENLDDARFCNGYEATLDGAGDVRRPVSRDRKKQMFFWLSRGGAHVRASWFLRDRLLFSYRVQYSFLIPK